MTIQQCENLYEDKYNDIKGKHDQTIGETSEEDGETIFGYEESVLNRLGDDECKYDSTKTYDLNDFVSDGEDIYLSLVSDNLGNAISDDTKWEKKTVLTTDFDVNQEITTYAVVRGGALVESKNIFDFTEGDASDNVRLLTFNFVRDMENLLYIFHIQNELAGVDDKYVFLDMKDRELDYISFKVNENYGDFAFYIIEME